MLARLPRSAIAICLTALIGACGQAPSENRSSPTASADTGKGALSPPKAPEEAVLELSYRGGLIANPDPTPFVRVFPGGRVLVHYPAYMKQAGDYELELTPEEVEQLLASFSNEGLLRLQESELLGVAAEMQQQMPELKIDNHGVEAVVRIRGESFTPAGAQSPMMLDVDQTIRAPSELLSVAAESSSDNLKNLATGVQGLEALARRGALEKIE